MSSASSAEDRRAAPVRQHVEGNVTRGSSAERTVAVVARPPGGAPAPWRWKQLTFRRRVLARRVPHAGCSAKSRRRCGDWTGGALVREVPDTERVIRSPLRWSRAVVGVIAGMVTGAFAAWAYYDDFLRPLGPQLRAVDHPAGAAQRRSTCTTGNRAVVHGSGRCGDRVLRRQESHVRHRLPRDAVLHQRLGADGVADSRGRRRSGPGLGLLLVRPPRRTGALGTAAVVGLLLGDAYRRSHNFGDGGAGRRDLHGLAIVAVLCATVRSWSQLAVVACLHLPCTLIGFSSSRRRICSSKSSSRAASDGSHHLRRSRSSTGWCRTDTGQTVRTTLDCRRVDPERLRRTWPAGLPQRAAPAPVAAHSRRCWPPARTPSRA